jgi:RimJ/RimL family protein N-acetyltransferase
MKPGILIKSWITKKGNQAHLRVIKSTDLDDLYKYANALIVEDTFVMLSGKPLTKAFEKKYLDETLKKVKKDQKIHLVVEVNDKFAGSSEVRILEKRSSHVGEIGISISKDYREEGIGTVCLQTLIEIAKTRGLKLLTLSCFEINVRAIHTYEKVGFKITGVIPGMLFFKNKYENEVFMYLKI